MALLLLLAWMNAFLGFLGQICECASLNFGFYDHSYQ